MTEYRSHKWISSGKGKALNVHKVQTVFGPVAKNPCNLISIFGRARQGKSFLMNCLAGEREIFKISNEKDSCTQGIDISNKWLSLSDFSRVDGGKMIGGRTEGIRVGFVDAEGQGDKDVSYDANLICPILLASKCVIFNWKGDLQKDNILSTLGIMARAAQNIAAENSSSSAASFASSSAESAVVPKFGHLHIIFRDWQAVKTDEADVFSALLGMENTAEATTRDLIRVELMSSFESIRVWLFEPPSEYTRDLKQKLVFEKTSSAFRMQVRTLREALAQQLKEPTYVAGNVLTGRAYVPLTEQIAEALNSGQVVLPSSAYLNMMRQEATQLAHTYEADLKAQMHHLLDAIKAPFATTHAGTGNKTAAGRSAELYMTHAEALAQFATVVRALDSTYNSRLSDTVGGAAPSPGSPVATILAEFAAQSQSARDALQQQFSALFQQHFASWLMRARNSAEQMAEYQIDILERKLPISDDNTAHALSLTQELQAIKSIALRVFGGVAVYGTECSEAVDAEQIFSRHFTTLENSVRAKNAKLAAESKVEAEGHLRSAMTDMQRALDATVDEMTHTRKAGYLMVTLEHTLNQEYNNLKRVLQQHIQSSPHRNDILSQFDRDCVALRARMVQKYNAAKQRALDAAVLQGQSAIDGCFAAFDVNHLWHNTPLEECEYKLTACVQQLASDVENSVLQSYAAGWMLHSQHDPVVSEDPDIKAQVQQERHFLAALNTAVDREVQTFLRKWTAELAIRREAAAAAEMERLAVEQEQRQRQREQDETVEMEECEESDEEEEEEEEPAPTVLTKKASGKALDSAAEQRRKAKEWAAANYGTKAPAAANKRSKKAAAPKKSVEQQQADAREYAKRVLGMHVGLPSPPAPAPAQAKAAKMAATGAGTSAGPNNPFSGNKGASTISAATSKRKAAPAVAEEGDEEEEDNDEAYEAARGRSIAAPSSSSSSSSSTSKSASKKPSAKTELFSPPAVPASAPAKASQKAAPAPVPAAVKVDPVKAAREEAKRQAQERADAAAEAAVQKMRAKAAAKKTNK